jgi:hypothetical protein
LPHAAAEAIKVAAPEATEAATAAPRRIVGYVLTREAAMVAIAKELPKRKTPLGACRAWI